METILKRYRKDFDELVSTVESAYWYQPQLFSKPHLDYLYSSLTKERNGPKLEPGEIHQELIALWGEFYRKYQESKPEIHIRQYLIRRSVWGLRDWFNSQFKFYPAAPPPLDEEETYSHRVGFKLDLGFLFYGTRVFPLSILSPYERYLIFLKFKKERTILEIAGIVQKNKETVGFQLHKILKKLRSQVCQQEHSQT